ncbi:signal peptide peptidase SppA [Corallococcus sp. CA041A]|uniref:signal peptide peptidase SppA n=1 Tax=Corallococcus sp. CA041A TaxID=2316727 RepID=UPI000EA0491D|nr:signal peptide peptidase SppA [Corallococcus sp. CA041A]RKH25863.1 signal peptide peptidase SppA [Corallococcus sp. CA041A]
MRHLPLLALLPSLAIAQTGAVDRAPVPPLGITLPPTNAALIDEAPALSLNPAGLGFQDAGQLFYLHERNLQSDSVGDAVFLGARLLGLGAGFSLEWIRGQNAPDYRKTSFGLSLGPRTLQLGAALHDFSSSDDPRISGLTSWDVGLTARPFRFLSLAAVAKDLNAPEQDGLKLQRRYNFGLGLRPLGERYTLGVDWIFAEGGFREGLATYTLQAEVVRGLRLGGGLSHGFVSGIPLALQLAATVDLGHAGLTYAAGGAGNGLDHVLQVRLSSERYRSLHGGGGVVALLDLDDMLAGGVSPALAILGVSEADPYLRLMKYLDLATRDERLKGVVVKMEGLPGVGWGTAEELRQSLLKLREAGKKVVVVMLSGDDRSYLVASAADSVYALTEASLPINGLSATVTSLGGTMEKLGVTWDVARVGEYKTAMEQFTRSDMSPAERETLDAYLDSQVTHYEKAVEAGRKLPPEKLRAAWAQGILSSKRAQAAGLLDGVVSATELDARVAEWFPGMRFHPTYSPREEREDRWGLRRRIAVVPVLGDITGGRSREDPLGFAQLAGAETVVRALQEAQEDPSVVAIILRVDSGGGDVLASDLMYRAVLEAKKHKPVIASMGDAAASGGYYAAVAADEVLAEPTTLTGSIGVFYPKPALEGLGTKLGVNQETLKRGDMADLLEWWKPWTPEQQAAVQTWVDDSYDTFITEVARNRKMDKAKVDAVARGRVWSGKDALARGLVDGLGGMPEAVASARKRAKVPTSEELDLDVMGDARGFLSGLGGEPGVHALAGLLLPALPERPPEALSVLAREVGLGSPELLRPGLKAMMPFRVRIR